MERKNGMPHRKLITGAGAVLLLGIAFLFLPLKQWILPLQDEIRNLGAAAPLAVIVGYIVFTACLIPGSVLTLIAGGVFGLWKGLAVVIVGANCGALCSFLLSRSLLRDKVIEWANANPKFAALDRAVGREGFKMVLLARLSPVFPFTMLNYLLGVTTVKTGAYVLANLIGMLPGTFLYVYLGATAQQALAGGAGWVSTVFGLFATIAVVTLVTRLARRAMAEVESVEAAGEAR
jgi:uncharacterized membrane protein YdjX (TVP38/TMEM64 family)